MPAKLPIPLPPLLLDLLLHHAPLDVLLFDTDLVCRYAALADDTLLGRTADELTGRPAADIFPPDAGDLRSALQLAAQTAATYAYPSYRYALTEGTTSTLYCWAVRVDPIALQDYRGREEFRGVLVTLADVRDLADENDRLQEENARLRQELAAARRPELDLRAARRELHATVRDLLAPVMGYLQALSRRPEILHGRPTAQVINTNVLPGLRQVVDAVERFAEEQPPTAGDGARDAG